MQYFKLLALAPVAASFVAASTNNADKLLSVNKNEALNGLKAVDGNKLALRSTNTVSKLLSVNKNELLNNAHVLNGNELTLRRDLPLENLAGNPLSGLSSLFGRTNDNKGCDPKQIRDIAGLIDVNLDLSVTLDIVGELCDKTSQQVDTLSVGVEAHVDVEFWAQLLLNLKLTLEASLDVFGELKNKHNTCHSSDLDISIIVDLVAKIQVIIELYAKLDVEVQAQLKVQFQAFSSAFNKYTNSAISVIVGLEVDLDVHIQAIVCLLDAIRLQLSLDLDVEIGGLLSIGSGSQH